MAKQAVTSLLFVSAVTFGVAPSHAQNDIVVNGDFETGDLTAWTPIFTPNGTSIAPDPVTSFDVTGLGASDAATFNVGRINQNVSGQQGAGISQLLSGGPGDYSFSVDVASSTLLSGSANSNGGRFSILFNGAVIDFFDTGLIDANTVERGTLTGSLNGVTTAVNTLELLVTRPFTPSGITPLQYFDNVVVDYTPAVGLASVPGPLPLLGVGAAFGFSRKLRTRIKASTLPTTCCID